MEHRERCRRKDPRYTRLRLGFGAARDAGSGLRISDFETGNPPEVWESEGQLGIEKQEVGMQDTGCKTQDLGGLTLQ
jgi:hypothetical protein